MKTKIMTALLIGASSLGVAKAQTTPVQEDFTLITLPYQADALAPVISKQTIELHHGKHLKAYVDNTNRLRREAKLANLSLEALIRKSKGSLFDNAGQLLNHNLYFLQFKPGGSQPTQDSELIQAITQQWGSFEAFQKAFEAEGMKLFGSGWLWLIRAKSGKLAIVREPNGSNPVVRGEKPILGVDLWEHAYYLDYQNKRADHIKALWSIINWEEVERRY